MKFRNLHLAAALGCALFINPVSAFSAGGDALRSHVATYVMNQMPSQSADLPGVQGASGVLKYTFQKSCEGWIVEHQTVLNLRYENNINAQMVWNYSSLESQDGKRLRFNTRTTRNGQQIEKVSGLALHRASGSQVVYSEPDQPTRDIPVDTLFPTTHLIKAIEAAQNKQVVFNANYFDGSGDDLTLEVSNTAFPYRGEKVSEVNGTDLPQVPVWDMQMAFFTPGGQSSTPDIEIGARYRNDGVTTLLIQDFGDFALRGTLEEFTYLDEPSCN